MELVHAIVGTVVVVSAMMFLVYVYKRRKRIVAFANSIKKGRS